MVRRNTLMLSAGALVALSLAAAPMAVAQEAIMLETIGAVRMVPPQEMQPAKEKAATQRPTREAQPVALPQHAGIAD